MLPEEVAVRLVQDKKKAEKKAAEAVKQAKKAEKKAEEVKKMVLIIQILILQNYILNLRKFHMLIQS